jgi:hypothetical protein
MANAYEIVSIGRHQERKKKGGLVNDYNFVRSRAPAFQGTVRE